LQPDDVPSTKPVTIASGSVKGTRVVVTLKKETENQPVSIDLTIQACLEQSTASTGKFTMTIQLGLYSC
jgi:hypothetical protein